MFLPLGGGCGRLVVLIFVFWVRGYINIPSNTFTLFKFSMIFFLPEQFDRVLPGFVQQWFGECRVVLRTGDVTVQQNHIRHCE